jgi:hypothetical protein
MAHAKKVALVIGNNKYEFSPLSNPVNDATDVAQVLSGMGFEVILKTNLKQRGMNEAIAEFTRRLSQSRGIGLFYFAGHGAQIKGQNYLLPIDNSQIRDATDLEYSAVYAEKVLKKMENAKTRLNIIILDACRDNPFESQGRSLRRGLARMQPPLGSIIAYATAAGNTASDSGVSGKNGLFTQHLLKGLKNAAKKHQRIDDMFMQISNGVLQESKGKQEPWYLASFRAPFCFGGCITKQPTTTTSTPEATQVPTQTTPPPVIVKPSPSYRYIDNGDGTVTDNQTGLTWLKNANCFEQQNWKTAIESVANLQSGECDLHDGSTPGTWRLPTKKEWKLMVDKRYNNPSISNASGKGKWTENDPFSEVVSNWYWSSTSYKGRSSYAWGVFLRDGELVDFNKFSIGYVWPVQGESY